MRGSGAAVEETRAGAEPPPEPSARACMARPSTVTGLSANAPCPTRDGSVVSVGHASFSLQSRRRCPPVR